MIGLGLYLLLRNILVTSRFSLGMGLFSVPLGGHSQAIPAGVFLLTALVGLVLVFFDARKIVGWIVLGGSVVALVAGVLIGLNLHLRPMSLFELLLILAVLGAGLGLFFRSLREQ
ncbi:MAG TPA: hypothetical protein PKY05_08710 [Fibrobacteria bacterium]|nr:hypothetical protein [Fibrobacteria bacterium]